MHAVGSELQRAHVRGGHARELRDGCRLSAGGQGKTDSLIVGKMSVTLHTTLGDLKIEVFCESVPKTAEVSPLLGYGGPQQHR